MDLQDDGAVNYKGVVDSYRSRQGSKLWGERAGEGRWGDFRRVAATY